jgi:hypothetical protein
MSDNKTVIVPARVVVTSTEQWGLKAVLEVQVPGTNLWLPAKAVAFEDKGGKILSYIEVAGQSLKRFAASIGFAGLAERMMRVDTPVAPAAATEELI